MARAVRPRCRTGPSADWRSGEELNYPSVDRHTQEIAPDDIILFWVCGPGDTAGVIGYGLASGVITQREYPKDFKDPDGPKTLRPAMEVMLLDVFDAPVITRTELKQDSVFADFDLFRMAARTNAFTVTAEQWGVLMNRLEAVYPS